MADKKLIYAVDDEENIRELYSVALGNAGYASQGFENGEDFFAAMAKEKPALILLDIMLDGMDGYSILRKLKENADYKHVPVIMVSAKGEEISKVKGLDLGADDYIAKPFGVLELIARINANLRKVRYDGVLRYADISIDSDKHEISVGGNVLTLTLKEYELLQLLVRNAPNVILREEIIRTVWGENYFGETRTLDMHVASLRKAIAGSEAQITTVRGVGYYLR